MLFEPYVRFHIFVFVRVTEWPSRYWEIAAHSAYDMFSIIKHKYLIIIASLVFPISVSGV